MMYHFIRGLRGGSATAPASAKAGSTPASTVSCFSSSCIDSFRIAASFLNLVMSQILEQVIDATANGVVHDPEIYAEEKNCNDDDAGGSLHVFERRRCHLLHLRADVAVKSLDPLRPSLHLPANTLIAHRRCH